MIYYEYTMYPSLFYTCNAEKGKLKENDVEGGCVSPFCKIYCRYLSPQKISIITNSKPDKFLNLYTNDKEKEILLEFFETYKEKEKENTQEMVWVKWQQFLDKKVFK